MQKPGGSGETALEFANIFSDCLGAGVIVVDTRQRVMTLTPEAQHILGSRASQPVSKPLETLPPPLAAMVNETLASGKPTPARELNLHIEERGTVALRACSIPVKPGSENSNIILVVNDLTVARRFEEHLQKLDRLANAGTLAASMAHEIKNALVAGKTFIDLLLEQNQRSELVDVVRREMGRIEAIVSRMLNLAAPGKTMFAPVHIHGILEHSMGLIQPQLESRLIDLRQTFGATKDLVQGDEYELQQGFVNLLLNASESMTVDGTLTVSTELLPAGPDGAAQLSITIKDTGIGILPENMARLFEPFFTTKPTGTGLGLAVTRRIVQEHHGHIAADSKPGEGTTFRITLPLLATPG